MKRRIGYEMPESGHYRAGFADIDDSTTLLSLVGDFEGFYTFDIVSGKKKKRLFQDQGSCVYSSSAGSVIGSRTHCSSLSKRPTATSCSWIRA